MKLTRKDFVSTGIFGVLASEDAAFQCFTLEHAYQDFSKLTPPPTYLPKIPAGVYTCVRGQHQLEGAAHPFETFEVTNVPGHTNILFHPGNTNADSAGCILLGTNKDGDLDLTESRKAFEAFMLFNAGLDQFELTVE